MVLGILAHVDAGKTTLSEAILYLSGEIRKPGRVDHGDSFLDDNFIERNRGITIFSRQARFTIKGGAESDCADTEVTLIDTPGHTDFAAEMERALAVIDYALLVVSASEGIQAHTKTLYRMLRKRSIPVFVFINKMDIAVRPKDEILSDLNAELGGQMVDFSDAGERSEAFIDEITLRSSALAEAVLESEDDGAVSDHQICDAVRAGDIVPCLFGSALKFEGVEELLEAMRRYTSEKEYPENFGARVYKVADAEDGERLCFIKLSGGSLRVRDKVTVKSRGGRGEIREAKVNQIRLYSGSRFTTADSVDAGTVCAVTGLGRMMPGDALGDEDTLTDIELRPVRAFTVTGPEGMDPHRIMDDLRLLTDEDPMLSASWNPDGGMEISIMGNVQLEVLQSLIKERFGYEVGFGKGSVLYRESIRGTYEGVGHFEPLRHYAEVHLIVSQGERGSGIVISSIVPEDELAVNWQRLILTHLEEKEHKGVLTGAPVTDIKISLAAGRAHDKHTSGGDFREATYRAVRNALMQARADSAVDLLEPWCEYEAEMPARCIGRAMTDIRQMGGSQDGLEQNGEKAKIWGRAPAAEISDYQQTIIGYTSGEGRISCTPCGYDLCHNSETVIEEKAYDPERDVSETADSVFVNHGGSDIVRWDEVTAHMHIPSVLGRTRNESDNSAAAGGIGRHTARDISSGAGIDVREAARRRAAAEKELRMIFEKTYGAQKQSRFREKEEADYSRRADAVTAEKNAERNLEIKAKHARSSAINEEKPVLILVDGYNVIYADAYLKELSKKDMGSARDQLIERLCNYAGYTGVELTLVFDAYNVPDRTAREEEVNGIRIIFTSEDESADIRMGIMTGNIKDRRTYVVSSDSLVQQDAWGHGALRISSREFLDMLGRSEQEIRDKLAAH